MNHQADENTTTPPAPAKTAPPAPSARPRRRRWLRRIIVAGLLVIVLAIGGAQVILWSDFPRRLVVNTLERQLGLRIHARSLSTGWFGRTTLRDVTASLPLSDEIFLAMPQMNVAHTSLVRMIFGQALRLERIELRRPELTIRQYASGRWNAQEAIDVVGRATRRPGVGAGSGSRITSASIPELRITSASVHIIDNRGQRARITPLDVTTARDGPIIYRYAAAVPDQLKLDGQLVPGGFWQHEFDLSVAQPDDWLGPLIDALPTDTHLEARWRGQVRAGALVGRIDLRQLRGGDVSASGAVLATASGGGFVFEPQRLLIDTGAALAEHLMLDSGSLALDGPHVTARGLRFSGAGGSAQLDAAWNRSTRSAELRAVWDDLILSRGVSQSGSVTATLETIFPDQPSIAATLISTGRADAGAGSWDARLRITGRGEDFRSINWRAEFARARYDWRRDVDLSGLTLGVSQRGNLLTLDELSLPERGRLAGGGQIDFSNNNWWLWVSGREFAVPRIRQVPLAVDVDAWGSFAAGRPLDRVMLEKLYVNLGDVELSAHGFYDDDEPQPVAMSVWLAHMPEIGDERSPIVRGLLRAEAKLLGTLRPLHLEITGRLRGQDLRLRRYDLGDPQGELTGRITPQSVHFVTRKLRLLDADWDLEGDWPVDPARSFELVVTVDALQLERLGDVVGDDHTTGIAAANLKLVIPEARLEALELDGTFAARDVAVESAALHADHVTGTVTMRRGTLRIDPLNLREGDDGTATASASANLRAPGDWFVKLSAERWPIDVPRAGSITGSTRADVRVDLAQRAAWGNAHVSGTLTHDGNELLSADAEVVADGRSLRLMRFDGRGLRGSFSGAGSYILDDPNRTRLLLEWQDVDAAMLAMWVQGLADVTGVYSGRLDVEPTNDPRALAPLGIALSLRSPDGGYGALAVNSIELSAFADVAGGFQRYHLVTQAADVRLADGDAKLFARLTRRTDGTLSALATAEFERLSLDQFVRAAASDAEPMPGRLYGRASLAGDPRTPHALFGDLNLQLRESDLANFDPIAFLYDLMRVGARRGEGPTGTGEIAARLDNQSLQVTSFYLFNRGVEVRGAGAIGEIFQLPGGSPIDGTLVGTARPLAALRLPFMADVDQILSVLQANATTVQVGGTLREPQVRPTTLDEVSDTLRALLLGDVQRERGP